MAWKNKSRPRRAVLDDKVNVGEELDRNKKIQSNGPNRQTQMQVYQPPNHERNNKNNFHEACKRCGKTHHGTCYRLTGACFQCGQVGHLTRDCKNPKPRRNGNNEATNAPPNTGGIVFALTINEAGNPQNNNA
ncbi:hypothetical protein R6Q59_025337 [Mikania micrantha]